MSCNVYFPLEIADIQNFNDVKMYTKCRVIGYLISDKNKFKLKSLDSKFQLPVNVNDVVCLPCSSVPQAVQIFGEICSSNQNFTEDSFDWSMNTTDFVNLPNKDTRLVLKAKIIQLLSPSLVYYLRDILSEIKDTQFGEQALPPFVLETQSNELNSEQPS